MRMEYLFFNNFDTFFKLCFASLIGTHARALLLFEFTLACKFVVVNFYSLHFKTTWTSQQKDCRNTYVCDFSLIAAGSGTH